MNWLSSNSYSGVPPNAVVAGNDIDGATIYVGRAYHEGDLIPAKVIPSKQVAYIAHAGEEIAKHEFHVRKYTHTPSFQFHTFASKYSTELGLL